MRHLHQAYLKMRVKKVNIEIFDSIETFFSIYKITKRGLILKKIVLSVRIRHLKKIILKERGFRGGSDEKLRLAFIPSGNPVYFRDLHLYMLTQTIFLNNKKYILYLYYEEFGLLYTPQYKHGCLAV